MTVLASSMYTASSCSRPLSKHASVHEQIPLGAAVLGPGAGAHETEGMLTLCRERDGAFLVLCFSLFLFCLCPEMFLPNSFMPDIVFTLSQTPTPSNKNIVGFIPIIFLFEIKITVDMFTEKENRMSSCWHVMVLYSLLPKGSPDTQVPPRLCVLASGSPRAAVAPELSHP